MTCFLTGTCLPAACLLVACLPFGCLPIGCLPSGIACLLVQVSPACIKVSFACLPSLPACLTPVFSPADVYLLMPCCLPAPQSACPSCLNVNCPVATFFSYACYPSAYRLPAYRYRLPACTSIACLHTGIVCLPTKSACLPSLPACLMPVVSPADVYFLLSCCLLALPSACPSCLYHDSPSASFFPAIVQLILS